LKDTEVYNIIVYIEMSLLAAAASVSINQHHLGFYASGGLVDDVAQVLEARAEDVDLERGDYDLTVSVVHHNHMEVLADVQGDA
jgi:hypothetical protein